MQRHLQLTVLVLLAACPARGPADASDGVSYDPPLPAVASCTQAWSFAREDLLARIAALKPRPDGVWDEALTPDGCIRVRRTFKDGKPGAPEAYGYDSNGGPWSLSTTEPSCRLNRGRFKNGQY